MKTDATPGPYYVPAGREQEAVLAACRSGLAVMQAGIEPPSTRALVATARLTAAGLPTPEAVRLGLVNPLSAEGPVAVALEELLIAQGVLDDRSPLNQLKVNPG